MIDLTTLTIAIARKKLDAKEFSAVDLASIYLGEIKKKNKELNVYLEIYDDVLEQAKIADEKIARGESTPLLGIPLAIKDVILIQGRKVSAASKILENYLASYNATVIDKLAKQGAVFLGRANTDEFAMGGSVRLPASFCGIVGVKPTYGRVSRHGLIAMGSSLDCIGPIAKTVTDAEIIFNAVKGHDILDSTSIVDTTYSKVTIKKVIGVPWDLINGEGVDSKVQENFTQSVKKLEILGFKVKDISFKNLDIALAIYYIIIPAEASTNLSRFDGMRYGLHKDGKNLLEDYLKTRGIGFGKEVRRRILLGTYALSAGYYDAYYGKAQMIRNMLKKEFALAFKNVDLIITPTVPSVAWKIGEKSNPLSAYLADIFTITANIVGVPAISLPSGNVLIEGKKLPLGIQFMAQHGREDFLFEIGKKFEAL